MAERLVLDTSAWIALDEREPGADEIEEVLARAWLGEVELHACFVTLTELEYIRTQERDAAQAGELLAFVRAQPVRWLHSDDALCASAAQFKAAHRISLADSFVAATALRWDAVLVHKDPELAALGGTLRLHGLPPKQPGSVRPG